MNMLLTTTGLILLVAQLPGMGGGAGTPMPSGAESKTVTIEMTAFYALNDEETDGSELPEALTAYEAILDALPYNRFEFISQEQGQAELGQEIQLPISGIFTFYATPLQILDGASVELALRVEMLQDNGYNDALRAAGQAAPRQPLVMRGMPVNRGELVVVVELQEDEGDDEGGEDSGSGDREESGEAQQDQPQEEGQEENQEENQEDVEGQDDKPEARNEDAEASEQAESAQSAEKEADLQNVESLLEYLEEVDRREQEEIRRKRDSIEIRGDWW